LIILKTKKNQSRVLLNPSFLLGFVYILFIANPNQRWTSTYPTKSIYFVNGLGKYFAGKGDVQHKIKAEAEHHRNLQEKLHLQDREEINLISTHPREIVPQDRRNRHRQGGVMFDIDGVRSAFKSTIIRGM
jgi:hypothetical protein